VLFSLLLPLFLLHLIHVNGEMLRAEVWAAARHSEMKLHSTTCIRNTQGSPLSMVLTHLTHNAPSISLSHFLLPVNGTPASPLSTPHSGKSPSPSPTSPGSLSRSQVRREYAQIHTNKQSTVTFSDIKSITHSLYVLRKKENPRLSIGRLHLRVARDTKKPQHPNIFSVSERGLGFDL